MLYLAPHVGLGTRHNPFRPRGVDGVGHWGQLDLSGNATKLGMCLVWTPDNRPIAGRGIVQVGYETYESLGRAAKIAVRNKLGVDVDDVNDLEGLIHRLLIQDGVERRWNPVQSEVFTGKKEVWIAGKLWASQLVEILEVIGIDPSDNFNYSDGELGSVSGGLWVRLTGSTNNINVTSNTIAADADGDKFYSYPTATSTADMFSQLVQVTAVTEDDWGPAVRVGSNNLSGYWYTKYKGNVPTTPSSFVRAVNGTFFTISRVDTGGNIANGDTLKCWISGSTLRGSLNGVEPSNSPQTDTNLTTEGDGPGVFIFENGGSLDTWQGGDGDGSASASVPRQVGGDIIGCHSMWGLGLT